MSLHEVHRACSAVVGFDRNQWAVEQLQQHEHERRPAYRTRMCTMPGMAALAKSSVLIGWCAPPRQSPAPGLAWY